MAINDVPTGTEFEHRQMRTRWKAVFRTGIEQVHLRDLKSLFRRALPAAGSSTIDVIPECLCREGDTTSRSLPVAICDGS